jgi:hypothetical protein
MPISAHPAAYSLPVSPCSLSRVDVSDAVAPSDAPAPSPVASAVHTTSISVLQDTTDAPVSDALTRVAAGIGEHEVRPSRPWLARLRSANGNTRTIAMRDVENALDALERSAPADLQPDPRSTSPERRGHDGRDEQQSSVTEISMTTDFFSTRCCCPKGLTRAVALLLLSAVATPLMAQKDKKASHDDDDIVVACYVPRSGTMYRIGTDDTRDRCASREHVRFSFSTTGPSGPTGPTGAGGRR